MADDHSLVRDGIRALLEEDANYEVIGEVSNGKEAVQMVLDKKPDLLIIDIRMPEMNGIEAVEELKKHSSTTKSIILSMHDSEEYILKSVNAGASGYLLKDTGKTEFLKAISTVEQGGKYFSGDISNVLVNNLLSQGQTKQESKLPPKNGNNSFGITSKELQILELVLSGLTNKQISEKLQKSKRTIETHRFNLMRKMGVNNLMDLARKAQEYKLI
ncbi:transcriptional regulatory protein DegU [Arenibacter sp. NBRC 103722]|uniref:Transcriptional regulatory protein DegU n=1 Tax=Arenibacter algicola TaxID=616991 RepID=A0A221V1A9_9FLAO|nr:transcriptional regulatory protein DegU [Arenibacter algicola]GBF19043.1 transcriptional regulatory protein DegU [Arenibacter sp. NBRC 103722]